MIAVVWDVIEFLEKYNGAVTAVATVAIAVFTIVLAKVTGRQIRLARSIFEATERAFVSLDGFIPELSLFTDRRDFKVEDLPERSRSDPSLVITRFAIVPRWRNSGNTPTKNMTIQISWRGPPGPIPPEYTYRDSPEPFFLAPKAIEPSGVIEMNGASVLVNWADNPVGVEPLVLIWARANYEDVFGRPHFVEWCYRLRLSRPIQGERMSASFIQWGEHNRADDAKNG